MNSGIKILDDERKVIVSSEILEKLKYLTRKDAYYDKKYNITPLETEMSFKTFCTRLEELFERCSRIIEYFPDKKDVMNYNIDKMTSLITRYNELYTEEKSFKSISENELNELINIIYNINIEEKKYYTFKNLVDAKNDCVKNMKYFVSDKVISNFNDEYQKAIDRQDIKQMKEML